MNLCSGCNCTLFIFQLRMRELYRPCKTPDGDITSGVHSTSSLLTSYDFFGVPVKTASRPRPYVFSVEWSYGFVGVLDSLTPNNDKSAAFLLLAMFVI